MDMDLADQIERLVTVFQANPATSMLVVLAIVVVLGSQKDGLFSRALALMEARAIREAAKEERRIEMMVMLERRSQLELELDESDQKEERQ